MKLKSLVALFLISIGMSVFAENFDLAIPNGWMKKDQTAALAQYQKGTGSFIVTVDTMPANANTPDKYIEYVKGKLKNTFKDIVFESVSTGKKETYETRELKYNVSMSGLKLKYDVLYIFVQGKAYTLTAGNMEGSINAEYTSDIKKLFMSFKLK